MAQEHPTNYPGGELSRYVTITLLVFSELNTLPDGRFVQQPTKLLHTGLGLTRLVAVIQGTPTIFTTHLLLPIIKATTKNSAGKRYGASAQEHVSFKIIADTARTVTFAIGHGALPSNTGRGYVLRRYIRRAVLNGKLLGINTHFLYQLVPVVGEILHSYYPQILANQHFIQKVLTSTTARFRQTLHAGVNLLLQIVATLLQND